MTFAFFPRLLALRHCTKIGLRVFFDLLWYLGAGTAIEYYFFSAMEFQGGIPRVRIGLVLLLPLILFVIAYVRMILDPPLQSGKKVLIAIVNLSAPALALYFLLVANSHPRDDGSLWPAVTFVVAIPAILAITGAVILYNRRIGYIAAVPIIFLAWAYVACLAVQLSIFQYRYPIPVDIIRAFACFVSPIFFVAASVVMVSRPRLGYATGLVASSLAWPYFVHREGGFPNSMNSWNALNVPDFYGNDFQKVILIALVAMLLLVIATVTSLMRLSPARISWKQVPLRQRSWPILIGSFVLIVVWFVVDVTPYTVPIPHHGLAADIRILYVEKRGFHFRETSVSAFRDGKVYLAQEERRPFRYRSQSVTRRVVLDEAGASSFHELTRSAQLKSLLTVRKASPREWQSNTWYVHLEGGPFLIYSDVDNNEPPTEIVNWFHEVETLRVIENGPSTPSKDVCLSFCYDPRWR